MDFAAEAGRQGGVWVVAEVGRSPDTSVVDVDLGLWE